LRHLNKEYILNRIKEIENFEKDIAEMELILSDDQRVKKIIVSELKDVIKKYSKPRKTMFYYSSDIVDEVEVDDIPDYPVNLFLSSSGYFKKITPQSLRMSNDQKLKEGDFIVSRIEATNKTELIFFTDQYQAYKTKVSDFEDTKASVMGDYIPAKLGFDENESVVGMIQTIDYSGYILFVFENGKVAKVELKSYETKTNRKKLANAYSDKSKLISIIFIEEEKEIIIRSTNNRAIVFNTELIISKSTRNTIGVQAMTLKAKALVESAVTVEEEIKEQSEKYRVKTIPAAGSIAKELPDTNQLKF
jgi:DNA gyrase subunit A